MRRLAATVAAVGAAALLTGCGSSSPHGDAADTAFLQHMLPHHEAALAAGRLALTKGSDPRVRAFGQRVLDEQQPEVDRMTAMAKALHVHLDATTGAMDADDLIDEQQQAALQAASGPSFDQLFLETSARSEEGAAAMARLELSQGRYAPARTLATSIASAPSSEIPQLRALATTLRGQGVTGR